MTLPTNHPDSTQPKPDARKLLRVYACQVVLNQDAIARRLNLTASDMKCYNILNCYGAMTPGELARWSGFTSGGITRILDHLEASGSIRRRLVSSDRRTILVEPLAPKQTTSAIDFDAIAAAMVGRYSVEEFSVIQDFLEHGATLLQEMTARLQTGSEPGDGVS
jgi:DNA-binding MarR family transcriptional regulator